MELMRNSPDQLIGDLFRLSDFPNNWQTLFRSLSAGSRESAAIALAWVGRDTDLNPVVAAPEQAERIKPIARAVLDEIRRTSPVGASAASAKAGRILEEATIDVHIGTETAQSVWYAVLSAAPLAVLVVSTTQDALGAGERLKTWVRRHATPVAYAACALIDYRQLGSCLEPARIMVEAQGAPAALVDAQSTVKAFNRLALPHVRQARGIKLDSHRRLRLSSSNDTQALRSAVASVASGKHPGARAFRYQLPDNDADGWLVLVPMPEITNERNEGGTGQLHSTSCVLVVMRSTDEQNIIPPTLVQKALNLTDAEGRFVAGLVSGLTVTEYANAQNIAVNTARWHLRNVLQKANCKTQMELVRLVLLLMLR